MQFRMLHKYEGGHLLHLNYVLQYQLCTLVETTLLALIQHTQKLTYIKGCTTYYLWKPGVRKVSFRDVIRLFCLTADYGRLLYNLRRLLSKNILRMLEWSTEFRACDLRVSRLCKNMQPQDLNVRYNGWKHPNEVLQI